MKSKIAIKSKRVFDTVWDFRREKEKRLTPF